jgi:hypothetical protein
MPAATIQQAPPAANLVAPVTTAQLFALLANPTLACTIGAPGKLTLEGRKFKVRASGKATTTGATTTGAPSLYAANVVPASNPLAAASWKLLGTAVAKVINAATSPWWIEADLIFDSISGVLGGSFTDFENMVIDGAVPVANGLTGLNGTNLNVVQGGNTIGPQDPVCVFAAGFTFGVSGAGNTAYLTSLTLDF